MSHLLHSPLMPVLPLAVLALAIQGCCLAGETQNAPASAHAFRARPVKAEDLRWQDIADHPYSATFVKHFRYDHVLSDLRLTWQHGVAVPAGLLEVKRLKPNFAYQVKLVGAEGLKGESEAENAWHRGAWASYQLGKVGRWWCEDCRGNTWDSDRRWHLEMGHRVVGYLLFDWFVTDASGSARVPFRVLSSLHVLWKDSQRWSGSYDSAPRHYMVRPGEYGYGAGKRPAARKIKLFGEWESGRSLPGQLTLPGGDYPVLLNLTEESFHSGYGSQQGGNWAQVLEAPVEFTVPGGAGSPGFTGLADRPWAAMKYWMGQSWSRAKSRVIEAVKPRPRY